MKQDPAAQLNAEAEQIVRVQRRRDDAVRLALALPEGVLLVCPRADSRLCVVMHHLAHRVDGPAGDPGPQLSIAFVCG